MAVGIVASASSGSQASVASFDIGTLGTGARAGIVFVATHGTGDLITGVTWNGVAMTRLYRAADTDTEPGSVVAYFLDNVTNGVITVSRTNNAVVTVGYAASLSAGGKCGVWQTITRVSSTQNTNADTSTTGTGASGEVAVDDGGRPANSMRFAAAYSGAATPPAQGTNSTALQVLDSTSFGSRFVRETTAGTGSRNVGFATGTTDDWALVAVAVSEIDVSGTGAGTGAAPTSSGSAEETFTGTGAGTGTASTASGTGAETFTGTGAGTQAVATATGSGLMLNGTGAGLQAASTGSGAGAEGFTGTGAGTGVAASAAGSGDVSGGDTTGTGAGTQAIATATGDGVETITGDGTGAQAASTSSGAGSLTFTGTGAGTQAVATATGDAVLTITGTGAGVQVPASGAGSDIQPVTGTGAGTGVAPSGSGSGVGDGAPAPVDTHRRGAPIGMARIVGVAQPRRRSIRARGAGGQMPASAWGRGMALDDDLVLEALLA